MGTRCIVAVQDGNREIVTIYRQFDGYPEGMGADLKRLANKRLVNGFGPDDTMETTANGMGCLAAQVVAGLKGKIGNVYILAPETRNAGEEYVYTLYSRDNAVYLRIVAGRMTFFGNAGTPEVDMKPLYDGPISDFDPENLEG